MKMSISSVQCSNDNVATIFEKIYVTAMYWFDVFYVDTLNDFLSLSVTFIFIYSVKVSDFF